MAVKCQYPNIGSAVMAWAIKTTVFVNAKYLDDYETKEFFIEKTANIFRVPTGQALDMKPIGQRRWNNEIIYADTSLDLSVDDVIYFDCNDQQKFRVINKTDYTNFGFTEYQIQSDYT